MVIGSPRSFFWRKASVVTFLRVGVEVVETGVRVVMVPSGKVGAWSAHAPPWVARSAKRMDWG